MIKIKNLLEYLRASDNIIYSLLGLSTSAKPIYMQIEPTNRCNLSCVMCGRNNFDPTTNYGDMDYAKFVAIIDQMDSLKFLNLSGYGEPFLNKDLTDMFAYAKNKDIDVETISNLTAITKETAIKTVKSGLDRIFVSIDSVNPTTYKQIRGGELKTTLKGLENLVDAKSQLSSETPKIIINTVLMKQNINEIEQIISLAAKFKVDVNFKSLGINNPETKRMEIGYSYEQITRVKKLAKDLGVSAMFTIKEHEHKDLYCYRIWFGGFIDWKGNLVPCCNFYNSPIMGNVFKNGFDNEWNSQEFIRFRSCLVKGDLSSYSNYVNITCKNCNITSNDTLHIVGKYFRLLR